MVAAHVTGPKMEQAHSYYPKWTLVGYAQWLAQLVNVCLQALLLTVSLLSIAYQRNVFLYGSESQLRSAELSCWRWQESGFWRQGSWLACSWRALLAAFRWPRGRSTPGSVARIRVLT